jgi:coproporphyrinogen III oxidase-like Fe-S oxidoreductase
MVGFPGETDATIAETISLMKQCPWSEFSVYPLIPYPGTPIYENWDKFGIEAVNLDYSKYLQIGKEFSAGFTIRTASFDENQVHIWRDHMINILLDDGRTWAGDSQGFK